MLLWISQYVVDAVLDNIAFLEKTSGAGLVYYSYIVSSTIIYLLSYWNGGHSKQINLGCGKKNKCTMGQRCNTTYVCGNITWYHGI